ncbi:MAG: 3'(2'),5'-bisphosphate nucleotidase CysQ family protein [Myxococcota bacterium]
MPPPKPSILTEELRVASDLAKSAGEIILGVRDRAREHPQEKAGDQGPVTEADLAADVALREGLAAAFPLDVIVSEESWSGDGVVPGGDRVWFVDPIDGTAEFIEGRDDYAVMIGLCVQGVPALGVIYQPATDTLWRGAVADGERFCERIQALVVPERLDLRERPLPPEGPRAAVSRSHPNRVTDAMLTAIGGGSAVRKGSVGLKAALIVDGGADLYLSGSKRIKVWDTAGPEALLRAAACSMTALDGELLYYTQRAAHPSGVCAWTAAAAAALEEPLRRALRHYREQPPGVDDT